MTNTTVISVLERRVGIGLRCSLGTARGQVRFPVVDESPLLSTLGEVRLGDAVTGGWVATRPWCRRGQCAAASSRPW